MILICDVPMMPSETLWRRGTRRTRATLPPILTTAVVTTAFVLAAGVFFPYPFDSSEPRTSLSIQTAQGISYGTVVFPDPNQATSGNASVLVASLYSLLELNESVSGFIPDSYFDAGVINRKPPSLDYFDAFLQSYQMIGFQNNLGTTVLLYYGVTGGSDELMMAIDISISDAETVMETGSDYFAWAGVVGEAIGVPLSLSTIVSYENSSEEITLIYSSEVGGRDLVGMNLAAFTYDRASDRLVRIQIRPYLIIDEASITVSSDDALSLGAKVLEDEGLPQTGDIVDTRIAGIRYVPYVASGDTDDYNYTSSTEPEIRFGYEYIASVGDSSDGETLYEILVVVDIVSGQPLMIETTPIPIPSGHGLMIPPLVGFALVLLTACVVIGAIIVVSPEMAPIIVGLLFVPVYLRIVGAKVLDNFNRGRIMGYISARPGATFSDISRNLKIANGNLAYHLSVLEKLELLTSRKEGRVRRFYTIGMQTKNGRGDWLGRTEATILATLLESGPTTNAALARSLGLSRQRTHYNLLLLLRRGMVKRLDRLWTADYTNSSGSSLMTEAESLR